MVLSLSVSTILCFHENRTFQVSCKVFAYGATYPKVGRLYNALISIYLSTYHKIEKRFCLIVCSPP